MDASTEFSDLPYGYWELWIVTQDDTATMGDRDESATRIISKAWSWHSMTWGVPLLSDDPEIRDPELCVQWLDYAARNKSDRAAYRLGRECLKGEIVNRDMAKAEEYLTQSADTGNQYAQ